jgi:hypothetical protein
MVITVINSEQWDNAKKQMETSEDTLTERHVFNEIIKSWLEYDFESHDEIEQVKIIIKASLTPDEWQYISALSLPHDFKTFMCDSKLTNISYEIHLSREYLLELFIGYEFFVYSSL